MNQQSTLRRFGGGSPLEAGMAAAKRRQRIPARRLLRAQIHAHPQDERGWLWLATVAEDMDELRQCLERVLEINPRHPRAHEWLHQLLQEAAAQRSAARTMGRCGFCGGLADQGRCQLCSCVQTFAHLDAFGREPIDEEVVTAAIDRLRNPDIKIAPRRRHLELALAYLNLGHDIDALFQLRLAARLKSYAPLRKVIDRLAARIEH